MTQNMIYASAEALSTSLLEEEIADNWLYPDIRRIRDVSVTVTRGVIRAAQTDGMDRELALRNIDDAELDEYIRERMYDPFTEHEKVDNELRELTHSLMAKGTPTSPTAGGGAEKMTNGNGSRRSTVTSRPGTANERAK